MERLAEELGFKRAGEHGILEGAKDRASGISQI
jgi:hypothetical protein